MEKNKFKKEFKDRLYKFTLRLIEFIDKLPNDNVCRRVGDQLIRSGTSIIGNYIEAQSCCSKKEFARYFNTSLNSSNESKLWLEILRDSKRVTAEDVSWFINELEEYSKIFAASLLTIRKTKKN